MNMTRPFLCIALPLLISGCAVIPGTQTYGMREYSSIPLPSKTAGEAVPETVKVKAITADLIIELDKARNVRPATNAQKQAADQVARDILEDYKIGPGDILSITVWDHPELTIPAGPYRTPDVSGNLVAQDGTLYYPYVGVVQVAGKTARQVRELLAQRLSKYIEKVQIDVRITAFRSKRVYVVGEVKSPGQQPVTDVPMTILDAVNLAGGFTPEADHSQVLLTRAGTTWQVNLQALYEEGDTSQNIRLNAGDIVNVPDRSLNKVFVLGEVQKPGPFFMSKKRMSLAEALANAGYVNETTSNPHWIFVMRGGGDKPELFHLDAKSPDALVLADRFPLQPRDIVYVDAAEVARWNRVVTNVLPTSTMLNTLSTTRYPLFGGRQP
jgi:polysaccharide export outer membrane protein